MKLASAFMLALALAAVPAFGTRLRRKPAENDHATAEQSRCMKARDAVPSKKNVSFVSFHDCPVELPTKIDDEKQVPYFEKLHELMVEGNGHLEGCRDKSSQEYWVQEWQDEIKCLYATILKDKCGSLKSQHKKRQESWELKCLDPDADLLDAYNLMTKEELSRRLTRLKGMITIYNG